ncbi:MAG: ankyrin repeat domain-containing protein [Gammaproteobacteria bacterium]
MLYNTVNLIQAAIKGDISWAEKCLSSGVKINAKDQFYNFYKYTPIFPSFLGKFAPALFYALQYRHWEMTIWLINQGADVNYKDLERYTLLQHTIFGGLGRTFVTILRENGAQFDNVIYEQAYDGTLTVTDQETLAATDSRGFGIMHYAASNGQIPVLEQLLSAGIEINKANNFGVTPLLVAACNGHTDTVRWLLQEGGASIKERNEQKYTALLNAAYNGHTDTVMWLLNEAGASIADKSKEKNTALISAAHNGHLDTVRWLLREGGASIEERNRFSFTSLLEAAYSGHFDTVRWLLQEGGASITERTLSGEQFSALLCAAHGGHFDTVRWLLQEGGASIDEKGITGSTALICASYNGYLDMVRWLLQEGGASIDEKDDEGNTPLLRAVYGNQFATINWLLQEGGASHNERNSKGLTLIKSTLDNLSLIKDFSHVEHWLINFNIAQNVGLDDESAKKFGKIVEQCHRLTCLDISNNLLTETGLIALYSVLVNHPSIKVLCIEGNKNLGKRGLNILLRLYNNNKRLENIKALDTGGTEEQYQQLNYLNGQRCRTKSARSMVETSASFHHKISDIKKEDASDSEKKQSSSPSFC